MKVPMWVGKVRIAIPVLLIISGTVLLFLVNNSNSTVTSQVKAFSAHNNAPAPDDTPTISGIPTQIIIPSLEIDLPVDKGYYNEKSQTWTLSGTHAHYATMTQPANNKEGNTFIYGHNNNKVFYKLTQLKAGDVVQLKSDNGHKFYYLFKEAYDVAPTDTSLLSYKGKPILTIQTCSGSWYQNRRLFIFDFVRAQ